MSGDEGDPLTDRSEAEDPDDADDPGDTGDPTDADPFEAWAENTASDAERDHPEDDPFERIGEGSGPRHGDPFDAFEGAGDGAEDPRGDDATTDDETPGEATTDEFADATDATHAADATDATDAARHGLPSDEDADDPFATFDAPATDPFDEGETVFDGEDRGGLGEDVWERMESTDPQAEAVPGKRYVDVNKHSYCETCEYFSGPPDVACSHEGTEILEFVDMETIRVADCPIVDERNALEDVD